MSKLSKICSLICKVEMKMGLTLRHEYLQNVCILEQYFEVYTCSRWYMLLLFCYEYVKSQMSDCKH